MWKYFVNKLRSFIGSVGLLLLRNLSWTKCRRDNLAKLLDSSASLIFLHVKKTAMNHMRFSIVIWGRISTTKIQKNQYCFGRSWETFAAAAVFKVVLNNFTWWLRLRGLFATRSGCQFSVIVHGGGIGRVWLEASERRAASYGIIGVSTPTPTTTAISRHFVSSRSHPVKNWGWLTLFFLLFYRSLLLDSRCLLSSSRNLAIALDHVNTNVIRFSKIDSERRRGFQSTHIHFFSFRRIYIEGTKA